MDRAGRLPTWVFILPAVLGLSLFAVYFLQIRNQPFARYLVANPLVYDMEARDILSGQPYGRAFLMSPLYPGFVALVYRILRPGPLAVAEAQGLLMALNIFLLGLVSRRLVTDAPALVAAFAMAFYWSFYYFAGEMVPVTLLITFMLLAVLLFLDRHGKPNLPALAGGMLLAIALYAARGFPGLASPRGGGAYLGAFLLTAVFVAGSAAVLLIAGLRPRSRRLLNVAGSGLLLGTACLVWSAAVLLALPMVITLLLRPELRYARSGVFVLALAVPVLASFSHNYAAGGEPVPVTTSFGVNIFIGNNPGSDGMDPFRLGENDTARQEADRLRLTGSRRSGFYAGLAYDYMRTDTAAWLRLMGRKALLAVSRIAIDNNADISERRACWKRFFLPRLNFGIIFPLALAGFLAAFRRRGDATLPVWGFLAFTAVCIFFFVCERFRLPGIVFLLPLAAAGLWFIAHGLAGRSRGAAPALGLVLLGAAVSDVDYLGIADYEFPSIIVNKAYVERLSGDLDGARRLANLAISLEPGNAGAHYQLGAVEEAEGRYADAIDYYLKAIQLDPYYAASYSGAQRVLQAAGVSTAYLDRYVEEAVRGAALDEERRRIVGFVEDRAP